MKPILIICNGPSAAQIDWEWLKTQRDRLDTFGMNNAYKMYNKLDFYPTYYANLDNIVIQSHKNKIQELLQLNKIQKLFLHSVCNFEPHITYQRITKLPQQKGEFFERDGDLSTNFDEFHSWMNTGSDAVQISIIMGYKTIYLIGADGYREQIKEAKHLHGIMYEITETPTFNPNYWFPDYLEKGDRYNAPTSEYLPGWKKTWLVCKKNNINLFNLSRKNTYSEYMPMVEYADFRKHLTTSRIKIL